MSGARASNGSTRNRLGWIGFLAAFLLALRPSLSVMLDREPLPANDISDVEATFGQGRARLPPGARVGWLLPPKVPGGLARILVVAQYALAPTRIRFLPVQDCRARGARACGAEDVDLLVVAEDPADSVLLDARGLGFDVNVTDPPTIQVVRRIR
jgi:hypothetical protein